MTELTKNFKLSEFDCHDGTPVPAEYEDNVQILATNLQVLRDTVNRPITITSGYRTPAHNKKIGGASKSQHLTASAADIKVSGMLPSEVRAVIEGLIKKGEMFPGGIGSYKNWIHYDLGPERRWNG